MPRPRIRINPTNEALTAEERRRMAHTRLRHVPGRVHALRALGSIEDAEPATRRAIELWAEGVNPWRIAEDTGVPLEHQRALSESPAAKAHYAAHRAEVDAARVALGASVPWLDLWRAIKDR